MSLSIFGTPEFKQLESELRTIRGVNEFESIISHLNSKLYGVKIIASFPSYQKSSLTPFKFPESFTYKYSNAVRFICFPYLYYHKYSPLTLPSKMPAVDNIFTFDSNFAGYINSVVKNKTIHVLDGKIEQNFDYLLNDNFNSNFDPSFYLAQNIKNVRPIYLRMKNKSDFTALEFWNSPDQNLKTNLINQQIFRSINNDHYRKTRILKFDITNEQAEQQAIQITYDFYASPTKGILVNEHILPSQRLILLYLIAMLNIQNSSEKDYQSKFSEFLKYIQKEKLAFLERESFIALAYFNNPDSVPILSKIKRGGNTNHVLSKIDDIAWDFYAVHVLETLIPARTQGDFLVPFFLTFDKNIHSLIPIFPIKAVIIDSDSGYVHYIPDMQIIHYVDSECNEILTSLFSERRKPMESGDKVNLSQIKDQYQKLRFALQR